MATDPLAPHPERDLVLDTAALRVLAHPMRLSFLTRLRDHGPLTGRRLAEHFGLDSGAVSYHLRKLADGGLIEEDTERGTRRDRWWRVTRPAVYHDPGASPADAADAGAYAQAVLVAYGDALRRYAAEVSRLPGEWAAVTMASDRGLRLTPAQATELKRELVAVIERYRGGEADPAAWNVVLQLHLLPQLES